MATIDKVNVNGRDYDLSSDWSNVQNKPFTNVDTNTLEIENGVLKFTKSIPKVSNTYSATSEEGMSGKAVASAILGKANSEELHPVATNGNYNSLNNKPALKTVATSGSYNDLSNKPTIPPTVTSATVAGWGFKTTETKVTSSGTTLATLTSIQASTSDITAGSTNLSTGQLYVVYE